VALPSHPSRLQRGFALVTAVTAVAVAMTATRVASSKPDVLERAMERLGLDPASATGWSAPFEGYGGPLGGALVAALVGLLVVFTVAWGVGRALGRRRTELP
jgi:hypothetical protein